jgi:fatty acid elongase 3
VQILQFVLDLVLTVFLTYTVFINEFWPHLKTRGFPTLGHCYAEEPVYQAQAGTFLFGSYLVLFIDLYIKTYRSDLKKAALVNGKGDKHRNRAVPANGHSQGALKNE